MTSVTIHPVDTQRGHVAAVAKTVKDRTDTFYTERLDTWREAYCAALALAAAKFGVRMRLHWRRQKRELER